MNWFKNLNAVKKILVGLVALVLLAMMIYYPFLYQEKGIRVYDEFLRESHVGDQKVYRTIFHSEGSIEISVVHKSPDHSNVKFELPNNLFFEYDVYFLEDNKVVIEENGQVYFKGYYYKNRPFLMDENNEAYLGEYIVHTSQDKVFNNRFTPSELVTVELAAGDLVRRRGRGDYLLIAFVNLFILVVDIIFPDLFFYIRHGLYTKDAEPSELYRGFQYLGRIVLAVLVVFLLLISVS